MTDKRSTEDLMSGGYRDRMRANQDAWEGLSAVQEDQDRRALAAQQWPQQSVGDRIIAFGWMWTRVVLSLAVLLVIAFFLWVAVS